MPLALTLTTDGLTWTATVTGTGGSPVTVSAAAPSALPPRGAWTPAGTRTGDGTLTGTLAAGVWWFTASTAAEATLPQAAVLAPAPLALATRCRDAVQATLQALALPLTVHEEPYPDQANKSGPWASVSVEGLSERVRQVLNATNDIGYGVKVLFCDRHHLRDKGKLRDQFEPWREKAVAAFLDRRLAGVVESVRCEVEPYPVLDPKLPEYQCAASGLVVWCWTRTNR